MNATDMSRSFVIPVLDFSSHSSYNINTLLDDLKQVSGEVICIFNSAEVFEKLRCHERIDKYCYNSLNAGVSRSWNMGINLAEGDVVFILNADLHLKPQAVHRIESYLFELDSAVIAGPQGAVVDFKNLREKHYYKTGTFQQPVRVNAVSGFFFSIHRQKFLEHRLMFDVRYSPCFMEEWDMGLQVLQAGLAAYAVPVTEYEHHWGITSSRQNAKINYFGRDVFRDDVIIENRKNFLAKWFGNE
jgi:GT2 family glycosyltransferase